MCGLSASTAKTNSSQSSHQNCGAAYQRRLTWSGLSLRLIDIQIGKNEIIF